MTMDTPENAVGLEDNGNGKRSYWQWTIFASDLMATPSNIAGVIGNRLQPTFKILEKRSPIGYCHQLRFSIAIIFDAIANNFAFRH